MSWKIILRNSVIVLGLTALGGFIIGIASTSSPGGIPLAALAVSNLLFSIVGFFICGCITTQERWKYLSYTAIVVWLISFVNLFFMGSAVNVGHWLIGLPLTFILMLIGGGISTLFVKSPK
ncbi:MAG: hypothetical protein AAGF26_10625 [Cyanobacteria bacterium P01_G01_bin.49]